MKMMPLLIALALASGAAWAADAAADTRTVTMYAVSENGVGKTLGRIEIEAVDAGLVFWPMLGSLPPGLHGFHLHETANCEPARKDGEMTAAAAAGSHFDPEDAGRHGAPWGDGHLGDLPALYVSDAGAATQAVLAPRLEMDDLPGHALMIHAGGDSYSDNPELGGGGSRIACGVIRP